MQWIYQIVFSIAFSAVNIYPTPWIDAFDEYSFNILKSDSLFFDSDILTFIFFWKYSKYYVVQLFMPTIFIHLVFQYIEYLLWLGTLIWYIYNVNIIYKFYYKNNELMNQCNLTIIQWEYFSIDLFEKNKHSLNYSIWNIFCNALFVCNCKVPFNSYSMGLWIKCTTSLNVEFYCDFLFLLDTIYWQKCQHSIHTVKEVWCSMSSSSIIILFTANQEISWPT